MTYIEVLIRKHIVCCLRHVTVLKAEEEPSLNNLCVSTMNKRGYKKGTLVPRQYFL